MGALRVLCRVWTEEFESIRNFLYLNKENCTAYVNESSLTCPNAWSPLNRILKRGSSGCVRAMIGSYA